MEEPVITVSLGETKAEMSSWLHLVIDGAQFHDFVRIPAAGLLEMERVMLAKPGDKFFDLRNNCECTYVE